MAASQRDQIAMTDLEVDAFLHEPNVMSLATLRGDCRPHLVAMWFGFAPDGRVACVTYRRSQKVRNIERVPSATALIESGDHYDELRGVQLIADAAIVDDPEVVVAVGRSVAERYGSTHLAGDAALRRAMAKRVAVVLDVVETVSWDHSKLSPRS